jgi:hypothetical protein
MWNARPRQKGDQNASIVEAQSRKGAKEKNEGEESFAGWSPGNAVFRFLPFAPLRLCALATRSPGR